MTFHPMMALAVRHARLLLPQKASVCEFGNQRNTAEPGISVKEWYLDLGFWKYVALDMNTEKDAEIIDLNRPVREQGLKSEFEMVTNNGTSEHIWNQHQVFENAHELCAVGGVMLHCLPFGPWTNHGFFNYNPVVFRDLAAANQYEVPFFWIGNRWGNYVDGSAVDFYREKKGDRLWDDLKAISIGVAGVFNVVAFKKVHAGPFQMPIQGKYQNDLESEEMRRAYGLSVSER